jgi:AcrR family transcriptional regulator
MSRTETPSGIGKKRERTRAALIAAALAVVEDKGFVAASLDEIAARAGMTKGAIYSNFGGKTDLMLAAARSRAVVLAPAYRPGASLTEQFRLAAEALVRSLPSMQAMARLQSEFQIYLQDEPDLRRQIAWEVSEALRSLADQVARRHGAELAIEPEQLVVATQALSLGFAHQSMQTPDLVTEATVIAAFEALATGAQAQGRKGAWPA